MSILESCIEEIIMENEFFNEKDFLKGSYNYEDIKNEKMNKIHSESFGDNYGKNYHKYMKEGIVEAEEEIKEDVYNLIKYDEGIYTNLVELSNDTEGIKYIKKVFCKTTIYTSKVITINLPDNTKEKKCIIQGGFIFNLEYYIDENREEIYKSEFILPFSKIIIIPMETDIGIKIFVKIEDYYLKAISLNSVILSSAALFVIYAKENNKIN